MATSEYDVNGRLVVKADNREFIFHPVTDLSVEFVFARTLFRMSDEVTDDYTSVADLPDDVEACVRDEGYETIEF